MMKMAKGGLFFCRLVLFLLAAGSVWSAEDVETQKQQVLDLLDAGKARAAIDTLNTMRLQGLEDPELYFLLGKANLGIGDYKNAEVAFKMALYFKNAYPEANYELGLAKLQQNYPNEALYFFDQTVKLKPDWDEARRKLGESYYLVQRYDSALDAFNLLIKKNQQDFISYYFVGKIRKAQDLLDAAVWNLQECLKIKPDYVPALQLLSQIYLESDRPDDALGVYDQILKSEPDSLKNNQNVADLFLARGKLRLADEDLAGAFFDFRNVQLMLPENHETRQIIEEIERKTNYDSLMTCADLALKDQQLEDAQLLFTKALVLAKDVQEQDSVKVFLDSLNTILNERKYEAELNNLYQKAEKAFSEGDYEQALSLYQKIIILNPTDQSSLAAYKESGSLKYFIQAIREWNNENWDAALKSFDRVMTYYPNFPKMKAKRQSLRDIKQIEGQQIIVREALENSAPATASDLFLEVFHADPQNPKLSELWFQIESMQQQLRIKRYIRYTLYFLLAVVIFASVIIIWFYRHKNRYNAKMASLATLLIVPTLLAAAGFFLSFNLQKPTKVAMKVAAEHASFFLEPDLDFEFKVHSDSVTFYQINQLTLEKVQLNSREEAVVRKLAKPFTLDANILKEPLSMKFNTGQSPLILKNCRFSCPAKMVLRPGQRESSFILVPNPIQKEDAVWFRGDVEIIHPFQVNIPFSKENLNDSTKRTEQVLAGNYWGKSLGEEKGRAKLGVLGPHFKANFNQPGKIMSQQIPIRDLSFKRFLPGERSVRTIDGFQQAEVTLFVSDDAQTKRHLKKTFNVFPNRFVLREVENHRGKLSLVLSGLLTSLQLQEGKSGETEMIPNYFIWYWEKSAWIIVLPGLLWLINTMFCTALLIRLFQQRQNEIHQTEFDAPVALGLSDEQKLTYFHEEWMQNLNQIVLPRWQEKIVQIREKLENENNKTSKDALVALLQRSEMIFEERKNELNKLSSGESND